MTQEDMLPCDTRRTVFLWYKKTCLLVSQDDTSFVSQETFLLVSQEGISSCVTRTHIFLCHKNIFLLEPQECVFSCDKRWHFSLYHKQIFLLASHKHIYSCVTGRHVFLRHTKTFVLVSQKTISEASKPTHSKPPSGKTKNKRFDWCQDWNSLMKHWQCMHGSAHKYLHMRLGEVWLPQF